VPTGHDLTPAELRVLGSLLEKQRTTPDAYPLTLNGLRAACNQATNRDPVMQLEEREIRDALDRLYRRRWTRLTSTGRTAKYRHLLDDAIGLRPPEQAVLAVLLLRGPQTPGELRIATERLHRFVDISSVEGFLNELAARPAGALVVELPRAAGARENRWAHLLSGTPAADALSAPAPAVRETSLGEVAALKANVARLEAEVAALQSTVARICAELGIPPQGGG
jgi:uncharacterized protein YceH (UPF0502 family)